MSDKNVVFLGPPGVGKGTIATMVSKKLDIPHISTGDLFRQAVKNQTPLGLKAKEYMDKGELVPDELTVGLLQERIKEPDCQKGFILDGFPRTVDQAIKLEEIAHITKVIDFNAEEGTILKRLGGRLTCRECKHVFNIHTMPPNEEGKCDLCQGALYQREDQKPEVIKNRLKVYNEQTKPLEVFYEQVLHLVSAEQTPEKIFAEVCGLLEK